MATLKNDATRSQLRAIRERLLRVGWIDKRVALELCDCDRLGARIWDLRHDPLDPLPIVTETQEKINRFGHTVRYARYMLRRDGT